LKALVQYHNSWLIVNRDSTYLLSLSNSRIGNEKQVESRLKVHELWNWALDDCNDNFHALDSYNNIFDISCKDLKK